MPFSSKAQILVVDDEPSISGEPRYVVSVSRV